MDNLQSDYMEEDEEEGEHSKPTTTAVALTELVQPTITTDDEPINPAPPDNGNKTETEAEVSEDLSESLKSQDDNNEDDEDPHPKKRKPLSSLTTAPAPAPAPDPDQAQFPLPVPETNLPPQPKKSKKKNNNVWVTKSTRKGKKKTKPNTNNSNVPGEDKVLVTPVARFPDKTDDTPEMTVCLSKVYKAEKVEVSEDRMSSGSTKGYRMVRATRGVVEGAWYFEIRIVSLGETGHTRLGWSNDKGDLQAPVGYDANSFGYRDIDGSKVHKALRDKYGEEGYKEGDVIGFYINLPDGGSAPKPPHLVWYKGQRYATAPEAKEDAVKVVPGRYLFSKMGYVKV